VKSFQSTKHNNRYHLLEALLLDHVGFSSQLLLQWIPKSLAGCPPMCIPDGIVVNWPKDRIDWHQIADMRTLRHQIGIGTYLGGKRYQTSNN